MINSFIKIKSYIKRKLAEFIFPEINKIMGKILYDRIKKYPNSI